MTMSVKALMQRDQIIRATSTSCSTKSVSFDFQSDLLISFPIFSKLVLYTFGYNIIFNPISTSPYYLYLAVISLILPCLCLIDRNVWLSPNMPTCSPIFTKSSATRYASKIMADKYRHHRHSAMNYPQYPSLPYTPGNDSSEQGYK